MKKSQVLTSLVLAATALTLIPGMALAQEDAGTGKDVLQAVLKSSLEKLRQGGFQLRGRVSTESGGSGFSGMIIVGGGGGGGEVFEGDFEGYYRDDGDRIVLSKSALPGFGAWFGDRRIVRTYYEDQPLDLSSRLAELEGILDAEQLLKYARKAEWEGTFDPQSLQWTLSGELPKRLIPATNSGPMGMDFGPKVMRVMATFTMDKERTLTSAEFRIVHSDPMAHIRRQMEERAGDIGSGEVEITMDPSDMNEQELEEGDTTVYKLEYQKAEPSKRIRSFTQSYRAVLGEEEF